MSTSPDSTLFIDKALEVCLAEIEKCKVLKCTVKSVGAPKGFWEIYFSMKVAVTRCVATYEKRVAIDMAGSRTRIPFSPWYGGTCMEHTRTLEGLIPSKSSSLWEG